MLFIKKSHGLGAPANLKFLALVSFYLLQEFSLFPKARLRVIIIEAVRARLIFLVAILLILLKTFILVHALNFPPGNHQFFPCQ
jgi:hypothetical protein